MGVKGIDGTHALSKLGRADLSVKRKNLIAKANALTAKEEDFIADNARFYGASQMSYAFVS